MKNKNIYLLAISVIYISIFVGCGSSSSDNSIIFNGKTYKSVVSNITGRTWLDRNLGADNACASFTDSSCFGDYYQWGREADAHQLKGSLLQTEPSESIFNAVDKFITNRSDWTLADENGTLRSLFWSKSDGTGICPNGYRVPTIEELKADITIDETHKIEDNFLKLALSGIRLVRDGNFYDINTSAELWSYDGISRNLSVESLSINEYVDVLSTSLPGFGYSVRCIKER